MAVYFFVRLKTLQKSTIFLFLNGGDAWVGEREDGGGVIIAPAGIEKKREPAPCRPVDVNSSVPRMCRVSVRWGGERTTERRTDGQERE